MEEISMLILMQSSPSTYNGKVASFIRVLYFSGVYVRESSVQVNYLLGGVARNVAECMSKLGTNPFMISALGLDMAGDFATNSFWIIVVI